MENNEILLGYSLDDYLEHGQKLAYSVPCKKVLQGVLSGGTGTGKSNTALWLVASMIRSVPTELWLCDFKRDETWQFMDGYPRYFTNESCYDAICKFYDEYVEIRNSGRPSKVVKWIVAEEYSSLINHLVMLDKQNKTHKATEIMSKIGEVLSMGRSLNVGVLILAQRIDSNWFSQGARENFQLRILLGNNSLDSQRMVFNGYDLPEKNCTFNIAEGMMAVTGYPLMIVKYPMIKNISDFKYHLFRLLMEEHL